MAFHQRVLTQTGSMVLDTVVISRTFEGDLEDLVAFSRTLNSRTNWPGAVLEWEKRDTLYFAVGMRLKAAAMTDVQLEERLGEIERLPGGQVRFDTVQRGAWPDGHCDATSEYLFSPGTEGTANSVRLTYTYTAPSTNLVKTKALPAFHVAMEKSLVSFLTKLIAAAPVPATA